MTFAQTSTLLAQLDASNAAIAEQQAAVRAAERANVTPGTQRVLDDARSELERRRAQHTLLFASISKALRTTCEPT